MLSKIERAPDSFEVEHIKVIIIFQIVNQFDYNVVLWVCKWTKYSIFTWINVIRVESAKFSFIFFRLVELLHTIMRKLAIIAIRAYIIFLYVLTQITTIKMSRSLSILIIMIKWTVLMVMLCIGLALLIFKII